MATVRKPSSLAARKMRMAISLRLAASSLRIGFSFLFTGRGALPKFYIVPPHSDEPGTVFSMHEMQRFAESPARVPLYGAAYPEHSEEMVRSPVGITANYIGCAFVSGQRIHFRNPPLSGVGSSAVLRSRPNRP